MPDRVAGGGGDHTAIQGMSSGATAPGHARQRSVMDDMVDQLAAMDAASTAASSTPT